MKVDRLNLFFDCRQSGKIDIILKESLQLTIFIVRIFKNANHKQITVKLLIKPKSKQPYFYYKRSLLLWITVNTSKPGGWRHHYAVAVSTLIIHLLPKQIKFIVITFNSSSCLWFLSQSSCKSFNSIQAASSLSINDFNCLTTSSLLGTVSVL